MKIIIDYNRTIFDPEADALYPGVFELLKDLSEGNELFLVSKNEPGRGPRLRELGIEAFFKRIEFVDEKSTELFLSITGGSIGALVVGDSIRSEIRAGNRLGLVTVRVRQGKFAQEEPVEADQIPCFEIQNVADLRDFLKAYE